jgi:hypothetical protein
MVVNYTDSPPSYGPINTSKYSNTVLYLDLGLLGASRGEWTRAHEGGSTVYEEVRIEGEAVNSEPRMVTAPPPPVLTQVSWSCKRNRTTSHLTQRKHWIIIAAQPEDTVSRLAS